MARRADDLLSIFDPNRSEGGEGRGSARKKSAKRRASKKKRGFQGLVLSPKQVWLGGSAGLLLLLLTFVLGLAVGRPGSSDGGDTTSLRRDTSAAQVMVRASFEVNNPHSEKPITRGEVYEELTKKFGVPTRAIVDLRIEGDRMVVELGAFRSEADAHAWIEKWKLPTAHINLLAPFRYYDVVGYVPRKKK